MKLLDLFCGAGGTSMGYHMAGFEVTGVDIEPQKHFPFTFIQGDALEYLAAHGHEYDVIAASPPCQAHTKARSLHDREHTELIAPTRGLLLQIGKPYIIENVEGAPLIHPLMLCGTMFEGLRVYRHRLFESNLPLVAPFHPKHIHKVGTWGKGVGETGWITVVGHFPHVKEAREAMGINWMVRDELSQAIPPAFTEYLGKQAIDLMSREEQST